MTSQVNIRDILTGLGVAKLRQDCLDKHQATFTEEIARCNALYPFGSEDWKECMAKATQEYLYAIENCPPLMVDLEPVLPWLTK